MDVVYPLSNQSKFHDDFELRYSLRSLEEQNWVREVYVVGHRPKWYTGQHLPCPDPYPMNKDANLINKILLACGEDTIWDDFLVNSDDQYFLQQVDVELLGVPPLEWPVRKNDYRARAKGNNWHTRVLNTVCWADKNGHPNHIFDSHRPYMVHKKEYVRAMSQIPWGYGNVFTTHAYFNIIDAEPGENCGQTERVKQGYTYATIKRIISRATFLNHNDTGLNNDMKQFLQERFPEPSRWEK